MLACDATCLSHENTTEFIPIILQIIYILHFCCYPMLNSLARSFVRLRQPFNSNEYSRSRNQQFNFLDGMTNKIFKSTSVYHFAAWSNILWHMISFFSFDFCWVCDVIMFTGLYAPICMHKIDGIRLVSADDKKNPRLIECKREKKNAETHTHTRWLVFSNPVLCSNTSNQFCRAIRIFNNRYCCLFSPYLLCEHFAYKSSHQFLWMCSNWMLGYCFGVARNNWDSLFSVQHNILIDWLRMNIKNIPLNYAFLG